MMIDSRWEIWDNQALTSVEVSHTNGNLLDLEENGVTDESLPINLVLNIKVGTAFATLTSGVMIMAITSDSATFSSGNTPIVGIGCTTYPLAVTDLAEGKSFSVSRLVYSLKKYLGVVFEPVNEAASAGKLDCWFGLAPISPTKVQKAPDGYVITAN